MYKPFFKLNRKPFGVSPDPRFFYRSPRFTKTLAAMLAHFKDPGGVLVLTGGVGVGKTTVLNYMTRYFPLLCHNKPVLGIENILRNIRERLAISKDASDLSDFGRQLAAYQNKLSLEKRYEIFAFDDVHDYPGKVLLDLERLQDAVMEHGGKFTIILAGDEALAGKIDRLDFKKEAGHISHYTVETLDLKAVKAMIDHRLNLAGSSLAKVFSPDGLDEIYKFSRGIPRLVNNICELSLRISFGKQEKIVSRESIIMAARNIVNLDCPMPSSDLQRTNTKPKQSKNIPLKQAPWDGHLRENKNFFVKAGWVSSFLIVLLFLGLTYQFSQNGTPQETVVEDEASSSNNPESLLLPGPVGAVHDRDKEKVKPHAIALNDGLYSVIMGNRETEQIPDTIAQSKALAALSDFHEKKLAAIPKKNRPEIPTEKKNTNIIARQSEPSVPQQPTKKAVILAKKKTERSSTETNVLKKRPEFKEPVSVQSPRQLKLETNVALSKAIRNNDTDLVRHLLMQGNNPNSANEKNLPLLIVACQQGYLEIAKLLLEKGASTAAKDQLGETALMKSVWNGSKKIVLLLLEHGADVNQRNTDGCSSLLYAGITGHYELAEILLDHGANPDLADNDGKTPLMAAAWNGHINIVDLLLKKHVDLNRMDKSHWTALMFAGFQGYKKIFDLLTAAGANPYLKNSEGSNAVDLALSQRHGDFSRYALN